MKKEIEKIKYKQTFKEIYQVYVQFVKNKAITFCSEISFFCNKTFYYKKKYKKKHRIRRE